MTGDIQEQQLYKGAAQKNRVEPGGAEGSQPLQEADSVKRQSKPVQDSQKLCFFNMDLTLPGNSDQEKPFPQGQCLPILFGDVRAFAERKDVINCRSQRSECESEGDKNEAKQREFMQIQIRILLSVRMLRRGATFKGES